MPLFKLARSYAFVALLLGAVTLGSLVGLWLGPEAEAVKPLGDLLLNLLFVSVVPLVFFSISSAVAGMTDARRLGKILLAMLGVFVATGVVASVVMAIGVSAFPPAAGLHVKLGEAPAAETTSLLQQIVNAVSVPDFVALLSKKSLLALIVLAVFVGLAARAAGDKGGPFRDLLASGNAVMLKVVGLIMYYAPIGLAAYFAWLVGVLGPDLLGAYARAMALYYPLTLAYFFVAFTLYAWLAGRWPAVRAYWKNIPMPALTSFSTGSSMASIPANLAAAQHAGVPKDVAEVVIPIGATIHMDGSCLSAILKIALLFGIFGRDFAEPGAIATAVGVALVSGTVMAGIPGGGFIGELMIITLYGFPPEALPIISMIGTLVDPPATMINSTGDTVAGMLVARIVDGKGWRAACEPVASQGR
ncbi:MAG: dicarboxylate/amino acid:cation symporter [Deltaproteobacteria bacterium]|nr:dicarboxylate/amino acid:cation symporter [Deltaproteobacteria bacterium]